MPDSLRTSHAGWPLQLSMAFASRRLSLRRPFSGWRWLRVFWGRWVDSEGGLRFPGLSGIAVIQIEEE